MQGDSEDIISGKITVSLGMDSKVRVINSFDSEETLLVAILDTFRDDNKEVDSEAWLAEHDRESSRFPLKINDDLTIHDVEEGAYRFFGGSDRELSYDETVKIVKKMEEYFGDGGKLHH